MWWAGHERASQRTVQVCEFGFYLWCPASQRKVCPDWPRPLQGSDRLARQGERGAAAPVGGDPSAMRSQCHRNTLRQEAAINTGAKVIDQAPARPHLPWDSRSAVSGVPLTSSGPPHTPSASSCSLWTNIDIGYVCSSFPPTSTPPRRRLPETHTVPDVTQPGSHLDGVPGLDHVLDRPVQLRRETNSVSGTEAFLREGAQGGGGATCSRKVFSLSGTSSAVVLLTSKTEQQGTVSRGLDDWTQDISR